MSFAACPLVRRPSGLLVCPFSSSSSEGNVLAAESISVFWWPHFLIGNSLSGRYPAFSMSSSQFAGSRISSIAPPIPPANVCTLFLFGSPHTIICNLPRVTAGVVTISSHPGNFRYHGGNFPFSAPGALMDLALASEDGSAAGKTRNEI